jgi:hypothetical protein
MKGEARDSWDGRFESFVSFFLSYPRSQSEDTRRTKKGHHVIKENQRLERNVGEEVKALVVELVPLPRKLSSTSSDDDLLKRGTGTDATELAQADDRPERRTLHLGVSVIVLLDGVLSRNERLHRLGERGRDRVQDLSNGCGSDEREPREGEEGDDCRNQTGREERKHRERVRLRVGRRQERPTEERGRTLDLRSIGKTGNHSREVRRDVESGEARIELMYRRVKRI